MNIFLIERIGCVMMQVQCWLLGVFMLVDRSSAEAGRMAVMIPMVLTDTQDPNGVKKSVCACVCARLRN